MRRDVWRHLARPGDEELVDDDLGAVHEVAVLRLPQHQRLRARPPRSRTRSRGTRTRDSGELCSSKLAWRAGQVLERHVRLAGAGRRRAPACRWLKVPRTVSWPVSRIGVPSRSSVANASSSAWAQSTRRLLRLVERGRRVARAGALSLECTVNPSGSSRARALSSRSVEPAAPRCRARRLPPRAAPPTRGRARSLLAPRVPSRRRCLARGEVLLATRRPSPSAASAVDHAGLDQLLLVLLANRRMGLRWPRTSTAGCRPARRPRCARSGDSRRGRSRRRCRTPRDTSSPAARRRGRPPDRRR